MSSKLEDSSWFRSYKPRPSQNLQWIPLPGKQSQMPNILENSPIYKTFSFEDEMSIGQKILQAERYLEAHSDGV